MTRLLIVCLMAAVAIAQEETARKVVAGPADLPGLCHRWEAPEWAPFEMKQFPQGKYAAQAPQVNADRAVVTLSDNMHLWLTRQDGKWGCVGWRRDRELSMEWLHQDGKPAIEFIWEGFDEMEPVSGYRWAAFESDSLTGVLAFDDGDESGFTTERAEQKSARKRK